jgi:hypothetical protein
MAQDGPGRAFCCALVAMVDVQVCPADTAGSDFDDDFIRLRLADRDVFDSDLVLSLKNCS